jgi:hypothetical protein
LLLLLPLCVRRKFACMMRCCCSPWFRCDVLCFHIIGWLAFCKLYDFHKLLQGNISEIKLLLLAHVRLQQKLLESPSDCCSHTCSSSGTGPNP